MKNITPKIKKQDGSALILVLWISLLLSLILVGIISISRTELRLTKAREIDFQTKSASIAALETAAFRIATNRDPNQKFTSMRIKIDDFTVIIEKSDDAKKLDLNFASETELSRYFAYLGIENEKAQSIAANIADWRDQDQIARPNGAEARDYVRARDIRRPANRAFQSINELEQVLDITSELATCATAGLTIFGEIDGPDSSFLSKLYSKPYPKEQRSQTISSLGTSARVNNTGGRYSLVAKVLDPNNQERMLKNTLGVFRVSGKPEKPYEWIVMMPTNSTPLKSDCGQQD